MVNTLLIDCAVALTRAMLVRDGVVTALYLGPVRDDPDWPDLWVVGVRKIGRVRSIDRNLNAAFVEIDGDTAFLALNNSTDGLTQGAMVEVDIKKLARREKYGVVQFVRLLSVNDKTDTVAKIDPLSSLKKWTESIGPVDQIMVPDGHTKLWLEKADLFDAEILIDPAGFDDHDFEETLHAALATAVALPSGGMLTIEETQTVTAIDIDTDGATGAARDSIRLRVNREAMAEIIRQIGLRRLGGQIVIDFLPVAKPQATDFREYVKSQMCSIEGFGRAGWTPSGLYCFVVARTGPSLLEQLTVPVGTIGSGRLLRRSVQLRLALVHLEDRLRRSPRQSFELQLAPQINSLMLEQPIWRDGLASRYANRFNVKPLNAASELSYECIEKS